MKEKDKNGDVACVHGHIFNQSAVGTFGLGGGGGIHKMSEGQKSSKEINYIK